MLHSWLTWSNSFGLAIILFLLLDNVYYVEFQFFNQILGALWILNPLLPLKTGSDEILLLLLFLLNFLLSKVLKLCFSLKVVLVLATKQ